MKVIDLDEGNKDLFCLCLEDWSDDAKEAGPKRRPPCWFPKKNKLPKRSPGKVNITAFSSAWCLAQNLVYERTKRAAAEFGDNVVFKEIDTSSREAVSEWGVADAVFVALIAKRVKRL